MVIGILGLVAVWALFLAAMLIGGTTLLEMWWWRCAVAAVDRQARQLGLAWDGTDAWSGTYGHRTVAMRIVVDGAGTRVRLYMRAVTGALVLAPRDGPQTFADSLGDLRFDETWAVAGRACDLARLTPPVRQMMLDLGLRLSVSNGWIGFDLEPPDNGLPGDIAVALVRMSALVEALGESWSTAPERVAATIRHDPVAAVRRHALARLALEDAEHAKGLAPLALADSNPEVRWIAARIAGAASVLQELCESASPPLRRSAALDLEGLKAPEAQLAAAEVLATDGDPELGALAARLAAAAGEAGEPLLMRLVHASDSRVARHAIVGLGQSGTHRVLAPLRYLVDGASRSGWRQPLLQQTMSRIRSRVQAEGRLALVGFGGGELSEVVDGSGQVSVVDATGS